MKINIKWLPLLGLFLYSTLLRAQVQPDSIPSSPAMNTTQQPTAPVADKKEFANPSVIGMGKGKGLIINYERQPDFGITSTSPRTEIGNKQGEVRRNNKFDLKAYAPLVNNPHFKMVAGFNYSFEEFNFEYLLPPEYQFYSNIEDKNLRSISGQLVLLRPINEKNFYIFRAKGELNGDYNTKEVAVPDYLKTTVEFLYGWKISSSYSYGFGAQLGYALGRRRIYPAFLFNRTFNPKWGIEAILPANADLRYNASERSLWFAGFSVDGGSYNINVKNIGIPALETLELRRSEIRGRVRWEREIYDFLWLGVEAGYRENLSFKAYENNANDGFFFAKKEDAVIENKLKGAALFNVELFLVPPRRFLKP
ncbi:MAG: hypothetical protein JWQ14_2147 [Adhaeribacter sp.]|nr:hypothetical protein [Adhaeribacter sp.]